jgi:hypothetical protein
LTFRCGFAQHEFVRRADHSPRFLLLGILIVSIASVSTRAGTIHLSAAGPSPTLLNVLTNEPVIFIADDAGPYAVVSFNWAAGTIYLPQQGSTGSVTLRFSGYYEYEDGRGGNGLIYVNIPPTCQITNPTNNAAFTAPASFDFTVDARNTDEDKLMGVDFWLGTNYLDGKLFSPFMVPVSNLGPGTYTLTAYAVDYSDAVATNSITITVQATTSPITFGAPVFIGGNLQFSATGVTPGNSIVLQSSTNLTFPGNWVAVRTNVASGSSISFTNPVTAGACFFRVVQLP